MPIPQGRRVNFLVGVLDEGMSFNAIINRDFVWVASIVLACGTRFLRDRRNLG